MSSGIFSGGYSHNLDEKNRVIIPQKFRLKLGEKFIITRGLNGCLWILTDDMFRDLDQRLSTQPLLDENVLFLQRVFYGYAVETGTDPQGRVALPANLREVAGINKEVVIIGTGRMIEIWSKERWEQFTASITDEDLSASAKAVQLA